ncbi:MAG: hypothetical protein PUC12_11925 [Clostridiales bacterium]|nr:hypothetical protein [Clostridiales bacterium]
MLFMKEFVTYLIKFVALGVIAVAGILLGVKTKKNKLAKQAADVQENISDGKE